MRSIRSWKILEESECILYSGMDDSIKEGNDGMPFQPCWDSDRDPSPEKFERPIKRRSDRPWSETGERGALQAFSIVHSQ